MKKVRYLWIIVCLLGLPSVAEAWGAKGHRIVSLIASHYLTSEARSEVLSRLGEVSMERASTWADEIRDDPKYEYTKRWHYATVPDGEEYELSTSGDVDDIMTALESQLEVLRNGVRSPRLVGRSDELMALKMVIHLVGDLHQPLHVGNGKDRGGNEVMVRFFGEEMNLHYLLDRAILDTSSRRSREVAKELSARLSDSEYVLWSCGTPLDWIYESISERATIYSSLPSDSSSSVRYYRRHLPLIEKRLLQAGLRLAMLLNMIYT